LRRPSQPNIFPAGSYSRPILCKSLAPCNPHFLTCLSLI
jgi:hypothetical protein